MDLMGLGQYTLASGRKSGFKIDCDALSDSSIDACAYLLTRIIYPYRDVIGVPRGGLRLAKAMKRYASPTWSRTMVVDDVWTTGGSVKKLIAEKGLPENTPVAVIFARGPTPKNVTVLFPINEALWDL